VELTIPAAVASAARDFGDATALAEPGGPRLSYRELHEQVTGVASAFIAGGVAPGDRVAIWSPNTHHWVLAALGALYAGATLVPVNTRFTGPEALDVVSRSGARALIVAGRFLGADRLAALRAAAEEEKTTIRQNAKPASQCLDQLSLIVLVPVEADPEAGPVAGCIDGAIDWAEFQERATEVPAALADARAAMVQPEHVSDILFTSGTTGRSKGAMSAQRQSLAVARAWAECARLTSADRYLVVNPFFHSFGFKAGILACLVSGATLVPQLVFDAGQTMRLIESEQITVLPGAPTIYQAILDRPDRASCDLSSLRLAVTGAATVPVALVERMRRELSFDTVLTAYGLTEAVVATMCRPDDDPQTVARTSGRAAAGFEIRIAGTSDTSGTGEILLRGPNVMLGYLDDPAATRAAVDSGGWLHTGDIGHLDPDGYLTLAGRSKEMIIRGGENIYPKEIEDVLTRDPSVLEAAVIGVPDDAWGEVVAAYVQPQPGMTIDTAALTAHCARLLSGYKRPSSLIVVDSIARNALGKIDKVSLRAAHASPAGARVGQREDRDEK